MNKLSRFIFFIILFSLVFFGCKKESDKSVNKHTEVVVRNIGHQILLYAGDSTSIVKPIFNKGNKFRLQFETEFSFQPEDLVRIIDSLVQNSLTQKHYLVEVESCNSSETIYSYEVGGDFPITEMEANDSSSSFVLVPCKTREQPKDCYDIIIDFIDSNGEEEISNLLLVILLTLIPIIIFVVFIKKKKHTKEHQINIGKYTFDSKNMKLVFNATTFELTSKENELLVLLFESANETVSREVILNKVWEDDGDYIGRTLDVYISKLRKKLELDPSIKLINVRGVGYKLIV
jgi:preprotein translocase subunit YajC